MKECLQYNALKIKNFKLIKKKQLIKEKILFLIFTIAIQQLIIIK